MKNPVFLGAILLFGICCKGSSSQSAATTISAGQGFSVKVTLSEKASKKLTESKETIIVAAYFNGTPKEGALKKYISNVGQVYLGEMDVAIAPGESAKFGEIRLKKDAFGQTDKIPNLLINVYSGRKSSPDNLLACGIYEGPLEPVQGSILPIDCKLIGE